MRFWLVIKLFVQKLYWSMYVFFLESPKGKWPIANKACFPIYFSSADILLIYIVLLKSRGQDVQPSGLFVAYRNCKEPTCLNKVLKNHRRLPMIDDIYLIALNCLAGSRRSCKGFFWLSFSGSQSCICSRIFLPHRKKVSVWEGNRGPEIENKRGAKKIENDNEN